MSPGDDEAHLVSKAVSDAINFGSGSLGSDCERKAQAKGNEIVYQNTPVRGSTSVAMILPANGDISYWKLLINSNNNSANFGNNTLSLRIFRAAVEYFCTNSKHVILINLGEHSQKEV